MNFTDEDVRSLVSKLDALDLTEAERLALHSIFDDATSSTEVTGFTVDIDYAISPRVRTNVARGSSLLDYDWIAHARRTPSVVDHKAED